MADANFIKLHNDACASVLGSVIYQTHNERVDAIISHASRNLTKAEVHYPAHKLEFLTLKCAVVEKFEEYLYGSTFNIYTENKLLAYILTMAKLGAVSR